MWANDMFRVLNLPGDHIEVHVPAREAQRGVVDRPRIGTTRFRGRYPLTLVDGARTLRLEQIELSVRVD